MKKLALHNIWYLMYNDTQMWFFMCNAIWHAHNDVLMQLGVWYLEAGMFHVSTQSLILV